MPSRAHLMVQMATKSSPATCWRKFRAKPPRPRTSPAVCRASSNSSKPASRTTRRHQRNRRHREIRRNRQGHAQDLRRKRRRQDAEGILDHPRRAHQRAGRRTRQGGRAAHRRPAQPARNAGRARRKVHAGVSRQRRCRRSTACRASPSTTSTSKPSSAR